MTCYRVIVTGYKITDLSEGREVCYDKISKQHEKNEMRKIQMTEKQEFWDIYNEKKKSAPAER